MKLNLYLQTEVCNAVSSEFGRTLLGASRLLRETHREVDVAQWLVPRENSLERPLAKTKTKSTGIHGLSLVFVLRSKENVS